MDRQVEEGRVGWLRPDSSVAGLLVTCSSLCVVIIQRVVIEQLPCVRYRVRDEGGRTWPLGTPHPSGENYLVDIITTQDQVCDVSAKEEWMGHTDVPSYCEPRHELPRVYTNIWDMKEG